MTASACAALCWKKAGPTSHVAIVARALGIAAVGQIENASGMVEAGDPIIIDGGSGEIYVRPPQDIENAYAERVRLRARQQEQYQALRNKPCVTKDGKDISLMINAGLLVDLPHIEDTGASGIGLFRTELQFMVATAMPRIGEQLSLYRSVLDAAGKKPVTFRTLDIGGDKVLPYMRSLEEENPALGWRAIRLGLDRPGLMRSQIRALLRASSGRALQAHVSDGRRGRRIRSGQGDGRKRTHASAAARAWTARARRGRRHGRGALAPPSAR